MDQGSVDAALATAVCEGVEAVVLLQHCCLGHLSFDSLSRLQLELMGKVDRSKLVCDACEFGKHTRSAYSSIGLRSVEPFALIHSNVWGPYPVLSVSGFKWFVTFIDCYSRMTWIYLMKHKSEVLRCFQHFCACMKTQFNAKVRIV